MTTLSGLQRNSVDEFYTHPDIAGQCVRMLEEMNYPIDLYVEPSAGNGSFLSHLDRPYLAFDIQPGSDEIYQADYLEMPIPPQWQEQETWTIGNPPFGRQSCLAKRFIKRACQYSTGIAFILPLSFKKASMFRAFDTAFHLVHEWEVPRDSFVLDGQPYTVPCVFQIWKRMDYPRAVTPVATTTDFEFLRKEDPEVMIAFRRVGGTAGTLNINIEDCNPQCYYFLRVNIDMERFCQRVQRIQWERNTVGPRSISKGELVDKYCAIIDS